MIWKMFSSTDISCSAISSILFINDQYLFVSSVLFLVSTSIRNLYTYLKSVHLYHTNISQTINIPPAQVYNSVNHSHCASGHFFTTVLIAITSFVIHYIILLFPHSQIDCLASFSQVY